MFTAGNRFCYGMGLAITAAGILAALTGSSPKQGRNASVVLQQLPDGGIQPQASVDSKGVVHVVFFKGKPEAGDLYYYRYPASAGPSSASRPVRVNSQPGTAMATGTIRTEQIAIGQGDRVHVVWNGISAKNSKDGPGMYMAYTRVNDSGTAFEPQQNLCKWTGNLDGGGSVAADTEGSVYAVWHTGAPDNQKGEAGRGVFLAASRDNGATFGRERPINPDPTGACACCSMRAFVDGRGLLRILYRAAMQEGTQRDTMLLTSIDKGKTFSLRSLDPWTLNACPMSSMSLAEGEGSILAAWETRERVFWAPLSSDGRPIRGATVAPEASKSKHPIIVSNGKGQVLFAWTEGTGWQRGGSFSWQVYDSSGRNVGERGHADGIPVWSLLSAYARPDGTFVILH